MRETDVRLVGGNPDQPDWAAMDSDAMLAALNIGRNALSADPAARLAEHGPNRLKAAASRGKCERFLAQFDNLLICLLLAAGALALLVGPIVDALVVLGVVLVNAAIGFLQEG